MVLFINNGWYYAGLSGGDLHVIEVAAHWARRREVGIAMPAWAYRLQSERLKDVRLVPTDGRFERKPPKSLPALCLRYVTRSLKTCRLAGEVVIAGSHYPYDLLPAIFINQMRGRPYLVYVFHLAHRFRSKGIRSRLVGLWERAALRLMRSAAVIFVDNAALRDELLEAKLDPARIVITWNAGAMSESAINEQRRADEVVFCGRITDTKGWRDLLTVAESLRLNCPGVILRVLGDGDRRRDLEEQVLKRGLSDVVRTEGYVSDEDKLRALQRAAAFAAPSREEGWGIAVSEALDAGAPVICYDLPVYHEVHGAQRLHLVPRFDADRFAQAVVAVVHGFTASGGLEETTAERPAISKSWSEIASHEAGMIDGLVLMR